MFHITTPQEILQISYCYATGGTHSTCEQNSQTDKLETSQNQCNYFVDIDGSYCFDGTLKTLFG